MPEPVVADSTCLIGLERIGHLDLLPRLFDPIAIPRAVEREFAVQLPWLTVRISSNNSLTESLRLLLDDGEAEAISLASELACRIILDDRQARLVARRLNLRVIGTVGVLLRAKQATLIPTIRPLVDELEKSGFYISPGLKQEALRLAGE
jgi:predicted nucleic acid-binding protein